MAPGCLIVLDQAPEAGGGGDGQDVTRIVRPGRVGLACRAEASLTPVQPSEILRFSIKRYEVVHLLLHPPEGILPARTQ